ncbi:MAG TPA: GTPase Era [Verrucomicrobiae bacterium]|jgi:GTP-binding protein Era|nr:GTPase Era [Verrucomicrobiae bacterium]
MERKCGFVSIIGKPNVGKSTLLNSLVGEKLAGVSPKPQTTRGVTRGIVSRKEGQIVYLDTPGFHKPADRLGEWMLHEVEQSLEDSDLIYWMVLPLRPEAAEYRLVELLKKSGLPVFLLVNQVDKFPKPDVLPALEAYSKLHDFKELIPISAKQGTQVDLLVQKTLEHLPEGEPMFPEDQLSDQNVRFIVGELIREKIYLMTGQEVPYDTALMIDDYKEREDGVVEVYATFVVEKESQKAILIGKQGTKMKEIGQAARLDVENFLGKRVFLKLWVKTMEHWKRDASSLRQLGYQ